LREAAKINKKRLNKDYLAEYIKALEGVPDLNLENELPMKQ
jgi:hypothetical protein